MLRNISVFALFVVVLFVASAHAVPATSTSLGHVPAPETLSFNELTDDEMATVVGGLGGWRLYACLVGIAGASIALMAIGAATGGAGWAVLGAYLPLAMTACGI